VGPSHRAMGKRRILLAFWLALALLPCCTPAAAATTSRRGQTAGVVAFDARSDFSHVRVRQQGSVRTLLFVRDNGEEATETIMNLRKPYELQADYARYMFASYLLRPKPSEVLIVGLGGGAMVQFLMHYDPLVHIDAVEIDPLVVQTADRYFDTRTGGNVNIVTTDGLQYLEGTQKQYDVIYMDAFLKPSADTDATGVPLRLKTIAFYKSVQNKLGPQGLVVFNLNTSAAVDDDLRTIRSAFGQVYAFRASEGNVVAMASSAESRVERTVLQQRARQLDVRLKATFSFEALLRHLMP
jgi:spermidine synthase